MAKDIKTLATSAKSIIKTTMGGVAFCTKTLKTFAGTLKEVKQWKNALGIKVVDITIANVIDGWGKYVAATTDCAILTTIYEVDPETKEYLYEETTDKNGRKMYNKIPAFYVWDRKSQWTVCDCVDAITRLHSKGYERVDCIRETPYIKVNGKLVPSNNPEHVVRALDETRAAEDALRAANAEA